MAAAATGETPALTAESDVPPVETNEGDGEEKEKGLTEQETEEPPSSVEPKMEEVDAEAGEEKPAAAADKAASEAVTDDGAVTVNQEATAAPEEAEQKPELQQSPGGEGNNEPAGDNAMKEAKEEPGEDSRCSGIDCEKSKTVCEDGEKPSGGGGELGDKRRPSVEISSSDGEPLSRMDSEDSISSTLMEMESTVSSGRSTPAMMNGQSSASSSGAKTVAYPCCWDLCPQCFNSSPDLAEHIRGIHVDGQRGGVFVCLWKGCKVYNTPSTSQSWLQRHMLTHSGDKPFKCVVGGCNASFASQGGLARHVPSHFSQQSSSKMSSQAKLKEESPSKAGLSKRKKLRNKRRCSLPRPHDFFDAQTMDAIRHRAICLNLATHIESVGNGHSVVFHSTVRMSYPVGIVPPRTKSPVPESSSIASYVTLRKSKKPDPRTERPRSAVEQQLCPAESGRPRMSVEEQLERIRRHQQGALREKKKGLSIRGSSQENTPSRSHSFTKENHLRSVQSQMRRRDEVISSDIQELEASLRQQEVVREQETPAEEIARLKEASQADHLNVDRELSVPDKVLIPERYVESDPEEALSPEQEADKQRKVDRIKALIAKNSMQNVLPSMALSPEEETEEEVTIQEKEKMINISYELAAEASKRSKLVAAQALASVKTYT